MSEGKSENDSDEDADADNEGQRIGGIGMVVGKQQVGLDVVVEGEVAKEGSDEVEQEAAAKRCFRYFSHFSVATTERKCV